MRVGGLLWFVTGFALCAVSMNDGVGSVLTTAVTLVGSVVTFVLELGTTAGIGGVLVVIALALLIGRTWGGRGLRTRAASATPTMPGRSARPTGRRRSECARTLVHDPSVACAHAAEKLARGRGPAGARSDGPIPPPRRSGRLVTRLVSDARGRNARFDRVPNRRRRPRLARRGVAARDRGRRCAIVGAATVGPNRL